jgi:transcriptional regulator with GAF, ATPase, and Fis domain
VLKLERMHPRLVVISGVHGQSSFPVEAESLIIGRDPSCSIPLKDVIASRKHCRIDRNDHHFTVVDLDSRNGTFVNGTPVRERVLQHGDRIEIGRSVLVFLESEEESPKTIDSDSKLVAIPTSRLRLEDALYLEPEKLLASAPLTARMVRGLDAILKLSRSVQAVRTSVQLERILTEAALKVVPAKHGSVILLDEQVEIQSTIVQQARDQRIAILSNEVESGAEGPSALLAAPLILRDRVSAVLYLETDDRSVRFDEDHLQLTSAIASIGAVALDNVQHLNKMEENNRRLVEQLRGQHALIGETPVMKELQLQIAKVAAADATVLIIGETGTGKEIVAHAIHLNSERSEHPFLAINCATLSESLLESELFGHEKGAFTGAIAQKKGKLEIADGGTVFLDETAEIPLTVQAKLLRVIQERQFERVGGTRPIKVNIRLIAATNGNLQDAVRKGEFREDLFYRLNVIRIQMPPLRQRREDILLLASYFTSKFAAKLGGRIRGISPEAKKLLTNYDWPGNVRELENAIERAVVFESGEMILPEDLPETVLDASSHKSTRYFETIQETTKKLVEEALRKADGNHSEAAKYLGVHPNNLYRMIKNLGIKI